MARKRRGRGEGSISQRPDGVWEAKISLGYDGNGKRRRVTVYGTSKKEVQNKLLERQSDLGRGVDVTAGRITLAQWLTRWLAMVKPTVEPNTYLPYERHVRLHIVPVIGSVQLCLMKRGDVINFYQELTQRGLSAAMQRKVGTTLTIALNKAVDLDLLPSNPATKVDKPKAKKPEVRPFDPDQVAAFLDAAHSDRLFAFYRTALDSGARPGELFALTWPDVDFDRGFISITKSLEEIGGKLRIKEVKTAKGRRRIDLSKDTLDVLTDHRQAMLAEGHISGPVFCDTQGGYLRISNLHRTSFKPTLSRAGLPSVRLYDLRHTSATLLLLADEPAKVVSERLGHASIQLTLDTYSHVLPTMQKRAADTMGRLLGQARKAD
jgi:integrase